MENCEFRHYAFTMIYLTTCAIHCKTPEYEKIAQLDMEKLFDVCQKHILTACVAYALESAGIHDHNFTQAKEKAIRKNILLDMERAKILKQLESEEIWYMPLKGAILKDWYPKLGMRQMSDNDILCDGLKRQTIRKIMAKMDFKLKGERPDVDEYIKEPIYNFEMHESFFPEYSSAGIDFYNYYKNVKEHLIQDSDSEYGFHFTNEDYYIYMLAHEYKHFSDSGTGVRSLVDTYIFLRKFSDLLDWDYINTELQKLGITDYEKQNRELAMKLFALKRLSEDEKEFLNYYIFSGTYGTVENRVKNNMKRNGRNSKLRYVLHRLFPPMELVKAYYPFFYEHKCLLPVLWMHRFFRGIIKNKKKIRAELDALTKK